MEIKLKAEVVQTLFIELTEEEAKAIVEGKSIDGEVVVYTLRKELALAIGIPLP